jgi:hypothetical protein
MDDKMDGETSIESIHRVYRNRIAELQAKIDELMLEYCPDEMTLDQVAEGYPIFG